jgi:predicted aconitase with swiveling domain
VLWSGESLSFFGGVDPETGVVNEPGHPLQGRSVAGRVLVLPGGKGSTVGSYTLYRLARAGLAPAAIVNQECEAIVAVGAIIGEIPCVDGIEIDALGDDEVVEVDGDAAEVRKKSDAE